jgi:hypothetical protein
MQKRWKPAGRYDIILTRKCVVITEGSYYKQAKKTAEEILRLEKGTVESRAQARRKVQT